MKPNSKAATDDLVNCEGCACFDLTSPVAQSVYVAGSFNSWDPTATSMVSLGDGRWRKELNLPPGRYEYRLVVDGQWVDDPAAKQTAPNPFGGANSVLEVSPLKPRRAANKSNHPKN